MVSSLHRPRTRLVGVRPRRDLRGVASCALLHSRVDTTGPYTRLPQCPTYVQWRGLGDAAICIEAHLAFIRRLRYLRRTDFISFVCRAESGKIFTAIVQRLNNK